jgi:phage terminase large subunit
MAINTERKSYKWKEDKNGNITDQPVKFRDHLLDGVRYGIYTHCKKEIPGLAIVSDEAVY